MDLSNALLDDPYTNKIIESLRTDPGYHPAFHIADKKTFLQESTSYSS